MAKKIYVVEERKDRSGWVVILVAAALIAYWKWVLIGVIAISIYWIVDQICKAAKARRDKQLSENAEIALRAERQNMLANQGDPAGIYGDYTPPTMPMPVGEVLFSEQKFAYSECPTDRIWK